jgi:hypothetical protein
MLYQNHETRCERVCVCGGAFAISRKRNKIKTKKKKGFDVGGKVNLTGFAMLCFECVCVCVCGAFWNFNNGDWWWRFSPTGGGDFQPSRHVSSCRAYC